MKKFLFPIWFILLSLSVFSQEKWDLQECIDYALDHNITVRQSALNIDRSEINLTQDKYSLLPSFNAGATHGYNWGQRIDPFTNQFASERVRTNNLFLSSSVDLFTGLTKYNNIKRDEALLQAGRYDYESVKDEISLQIGLLYLQILINKESVTVSENQVEITARQVERMKILVEGGQSPRVELLDIQSQKAQEELNLVNARNAVAISKLNLTQLLQLTPEEAENFEIEVPDLSAQGLEMMATEPAAIYQKAVDNRPQVKAAAAREESAEYNLSSARGQYYPNLSFSASIGSGYSGINRVPIGLGTNIGTVPIGIVESTGETVFSIQEQIIYGDEDYRTKSFSQQLEDNFNQNIQFSLTIPIFNGLAARSNVRHAKIDKIDAELNHLQVLDDLRFDIEQAYADAKASLNSYIAAQKAVDALEESFAYAEVRYEQQVITAVDFNNTKTQYTNAKISLLRAKYDFVFKLKVLDFYMGNPLTLEN